MDAHENAGIEQAQAIQPKVIDLFELFSASQIIAHSKAVTVAIVKTKVIVK